MLDTPFQGSVIMAGTGIITMSMREIDRLKVIQAVVDGNLKPMQAVSHLALTTGRYSGWCIAIGPTALIAWCLGWQTSNNRVCLVGPVKS